MLTSSITSVHGDALVIQHHLLGLTYCNGSSQKGMFGRFIALGAIRVESLCRKRLTWAVLLPTPILQYKKCPFPIWHPKKFCKFLRKRVCEMGWKARMGNGCWLSLNLVRFVGWSWIGAADTWQEGASCGVVVTSHQLEGPVGNQPRQGGPVQARWRFFSPLAKKSEKLSQFLKTVCREWDGGWKIEMCHIKGVLKRWQLVPEPWTWQLKQLLG